MSAGKTLIYVTMTDKFMSGWGCAKGKHNKLVFVCNGWEQADIVATNGQNRPEMTHVRTRTSSPSYNKELYYTQFKTIEDYPTWYEANSFHNK
jgi:hypothetical protein